MRGSWFRHFQSCFVGLVLVALIAAGVILWKVNQRGFSGEWGEQLQEQLEAQGFHAEFSSVRLSFSRGLIARDLKIYTDVERSTLLASVEHLTLDIDRSYALRGQWNVRSARFENAYVRLPEKFAPHHLSGLTGKADLCRENCLSISETTGRLGELAIELDAELTDFTFAKEEEADDEEQIDPLDNFLAFLHTEVAKWTVLDENDPKLTLKVTGSLARPSTMEGTFLLEAPRVARLEYEIADLNTEGRITMTSLHLEDVSFHDDEGTFKGEGLFDFINREVRFEALSEANLARLLKQGLEVDKLDKITFTTPPKITVKGQATFAVDEKPTVNLTGHLAAQDFELLGNTWSSLSSDYSWQEGNLYLRDLVLNHPEGDLTGKLLFQNDIVRYQAVTSLPPKLFDPFIKPESNIRKTLDLTQFTKDTEIDIKLTGSIRPSDLQDWSASGQIRIENFKYNKVPANYAAARFNLTPLQAVYTNPEIELDLTNDPSYRAFGGPESAVVRADRINFDRTEGLSHVEHLHGVCWAGPVLRLFVPATADLLERTYRTTEPPSFSSSGVADMIPPNTRSSFHTRLEAAAPMYYDFMGKAVELRETSVLIHSRHRQVDVPKLSSYAFSGPIEGQLSILLPNRPGLKHLTSAGTSAGPAFGCPTSEKPMALIP